MIKNYKPSEMKTEITYSINFDRDAHGGATFPCDENGKILDMDCNTILEVTKNFVATLLIGRSLRDDVQMLEKEIKERYFALTQKPLIACIKDAHNRYMMVTGQK